MSEPASDVLSAKEEEADVYFQPVIKLTEKVDVKTHEEDELEMFQARAKLWRYDAGDGAKSPEWKERGTGNVRLLEHKEKKTWRLVMRREGTKKVCANHDITPDTKLKPFTLKENTWIYHTAADYSDVIAYGDLPQAETFLIKLGKDDSGPFGTIFEKGRQQNIKVRGQAEDTPDASANASEETASKKDGDGAKKEEDKEKNSE